MHISGSALVLFLQKSTVLLCSPWLMQNIFLLSQFLACGLVSVCFLRLNAWNMFCVSHIWKAIKFPSFISFRVSCFCHSMQWEYPHSQHTVCDHLNKFPSNEFFFRFHLQNDICIFLSLLWFCFCKNQLYFYVRHGSCKTYFYCLSFLLVVLSQSVINVSMPENVSHVSYLWNNDIS